MTKKTLGILGGIGPESTGYFYLNLISKFVKEFRPQNNTEYPHILVNSIPAPDLISNDVTDEVLNHYREGLKLLEQAGADFIAIVCNGAYAFNKMLQADLVVPIINLPKEVGMRLEKHDATSITILGTPTTTTSNIYIFDNIKNVPLTNDEVNELAKAISNYNLGIAKDTQSRFVEELATKYLKEPNNRLVLACSEVALMLKDKIPHSQAIDPMDVLADTVLSIYKE